MMAMVMPLFQRVSQYTLVRYILASVGALAVDIGSFLALLSFGVPAVAASALGYALGIAAHWLLSSRAVFADSVAQTGPARVRQQALFVGSALVGLAITTVVVGAMAHLGLDPRLAKILAIVLSFAATWVLRKQVVFRA